MNCSVAMYSRRPHRLPDTIKSVLATANHPESIEFVLRFDSDDMASLAAIPELEKMGNVTAVIGEPQGYCGYPCALWEMYQVCKGKWIWHFDDDATMDPQSSGWDDKLLAINPEKTAVVPQINRLGGSTYFQDSSCPFMWLPNEWWKTIGLAKLDGKHQPFDVFIFHYVVPEHRWSIQFLQGVSTWHQRIGTDPLNQLQRRF